MEAETFTDVQAPLDQPVSKRESPIAQAIGVSLEVFRKDRLALAGAIIYVVLILVALAAPLIAPYGELEVVQDEVGIWLSNQKPSEQFRLGTTNLGRDIFSQLIFGTRSALLVGFSAAVAVALIGTLVGLVSGYFGGWIDTVLMRLTDIAFGIPFLPLIIILVAFLKPSIWNIVLAMAGLLWRDSARVIRAQVLLVKEKSFVKAARVSGASDLRIMLLYVAPSILPLTFLYGSLAVGWAILTEASVSFLGFGDPNTVSWGYMLQDAFVSQAMSRGATYWIVPPGVCIMLAVMAGFFIGRGFEEVLFPQLRRQ